MNIFHSNCLFIIYVSYFICFLLSIILFVAKRSLKSLACSSYKYLCLVQSVFKVMLCQYAFANFVKYFPNIDLYFFIELHAILIGLVESPSLIEILKLNFFVYPIDNT